MSKLVVIDGNSLMHRAYHALPPMNNKDGVPTNAIFGFLSMLLKVIETEQPENLLVAFDTHAPTPRHIAYADYKAGRKETENELRMQFPIIEELLPQLGITVAKQDGLEADDFLGIFSILGEAQGYDVRLVTGDRDALQLVSERTNVILTKKGISDTELCNIEWIHEKYGIEPKQLIEVKGLMGDSSDNIPGIPGVGEKTALKLICEYGSVANTIAHAEELKGKLKDKVKEYAQQACMSREIGIIITQAPSLCLTLEDTRFDPYAMVNAADALMKLELRSILKRLPQKEKQIQQTENIEKCITKVISTAQEFSVLVQQLCLRDKIAVAWDTELSVYSDGTLYHINLKKDLLGDGLDWDDAFEILSQIMGKGKPYKYLYDTKHWAHELMNRGKVLSSANFDAMIAAYLLSPIQSGYAPKDLVSDYLQSTVLNASTLYLLCEKFEKELAQKGLLNLFETVEMPLVYVLLDMERTGFKVDVSVLQELGRQYSLQIETLKTEIYALAGEEFNILSPKQLGMILFDKLSLPSFKKTKTGYSTDAETLESLLSLHPIVAKVLEYRQNTKLKSTYIDGLLAAADRNGKIHTSFNQTVTVTGRLSSTEPNLQNIPVRTQMGRELRKAFVASEGSLLVGADYSQIELRVLAHISQDSVMIESFKRGEDIHARTAAEVDGVPFEQVTSEMRSAAKAVNFGIVYGISDYGLARQLGIGRYQAGEYIKAYLEKYRGVAQYMECIVSDGKRDGFVTTMFGRRRELPELRSSNYNTRSFGERAAMNTPIQGTAADIIKIAMIKVHTALQEHKLRAKLILQVHDELIVDTPQEEVEQVMLILKECMENVIKLDASLIADVHCGKSWYDTK